MVKDGLIDWIRKHWYCDRPTEKRLHMEAWGADFLVVWAMATTTDGFKKDGLSVATPESMGVQFLKQALEASMRLHKYRNEHRQEFFRRDYPHMNSIRQWLHALLEGKHKGRGEEGYDENGEMTGEANEEEPDGAGWTTDEDEEDWAKRFLEGHEEETPGDVSDEEDEWPDNDDVDYDS